MAGEWADMPRRVGHPCAAPGCPAVVQAGAYCSEHQRDRAAVRRSTRPTARASPSRRGYDRRWQRQRVMFLARHPLCVNCEKEGRVTAATEVDHVVPLAQGGTNDDDNLQALCHSCHSRKTATDQGWGG